MRATSIKIHNFRSFGDVEINLSPYSLLVGANNTGKSNFIDAIRVFYEKGIGFDEKRDFPKFHTSDKESWIEIEFRPSTQEFDSLKDEYKLPDGTFRVRKYLQSIEEDDTGKIKTGIYAYVGGQLSNTRFYGAKNVQQGKFGDVIYIPAVSKLDEHTKLTGPSALRELINTVLKKVIDNSPSYGEFKSAIEIFGTKLKTESTSDGQSLQLIEDDISKEIEDWGTKFELTVNPIEAGEIAKLLIGHKLQDQALGHSFDSSSYGQGFQRHLIFTLIKLSSRYAFSEKPETKKEFSPQLTWILFEEPEAFLHPSQIDVLDTSLRSIAENEASQVLISTHNPEFVSLNIEDLPSLARVCKDGVASTICQITQETLSSLISDNQKNLTKWKSSGIPIHPDDLLMDMESIKYALWLNPRRCCAFFANKVLLVEGPTESALFGYLLGIGQVPGPAGGLFILDTMGKFNVHRFMSLLKELGIWHAILYDHDSGKYPEIDKTIQDSANKFTLGIDSFPQDLESFLNIPKAGMSHRKPQHVMWYLHQKRISQDSLDALVSKIRVLLKI